jgi:putative ABC transport system substrate-binding protein
MAATTSLPIVMANVNDPVGLGFIESLGRPGANGTGVAGVERELGPKRLQLLVEAVPTIKKVAVFGPGIEPTPLLADAAISMGVTLLCVPITTEDDYPAGVERAVAEGADALLLLRAGPPGAGPVASLAERHRLPTMYANTGGVFAGGLMAYDIRSPEIYRRVADYVDRILRGARPADLPVETPTRFDLIVNMRTARALGLTLPPTFLARVDEMIE